MNKELKHQICSLFEVVEDPSGIQRIITPLEYPLSGDRIVVRVRENASGFRVDENGEAALFASMAGGDTHADAVTRWAEDIIVAGIIAIDDEDVIYTEPKSPELIAPAIFRVAEAAQQLYSISTSRSTRQTNNFKERVGSVVFDASKEFGFKFTADEELPIAGGMIADYVIEADRPLIIIAASSLTRLLEAEIIHMQYKLSKRPGFVVAVAESASIVGKKQFERANYYTDKTVSFNPHDFHQLLVGQLASQHS